MKSTLIALSALSAVTIAATPAVADSSFSNGAGPEPRQQQRQLLPMLDMTPTASVGGGFVTERFYDRTCQCDVTRIIDRSTGAVIHRSERGS